MTELSTDEEYWLNHQPWLLSLGYQLRPRFRPGWVPSWVTRPGKDIFALKQREDFLRHRGIAPIMDAIRLSDNRQVMMKKIYSKEVRLGVYEHQHLINAYVSSPDQLEDPDNHCIPCIEILRIPGDHRHVILVMPLCRRWYVPRFDTVGEALDMIQQAFKGLQYLHRNRIAHRDCTGFNFVMDGSGMYPNGFHPIAQEHNREFTGPAFQKYTRTQCPPKYYWIDFEFSFQFDPSDPCPRIIPLHAADESAPEYRHLKANPEGPHALVDPFPTDVYYLGNMVKMFFTEGSTWFELRRRFGFGFLKPLVEAMTQEDPARRPNMDQCVIQLEEIINAQYSWTLRSQVWHPTDNPLGFIYRFFPHWARRIVYIITRTPAIPSRNRRPSPYLRLYTHLLLALWVIMALMMQYYPRNVLETSIPARPIVSLY